MKKLNDQGFTLIELLLSLVISVVIIGSLVAFMLTSSNSYVTNKNEFNIQSEAQSTMNYISDIIIESEDTELNNYMVGGTPWKTLIARTTEKGVKEVHMFSLDPNQRKIYYDKRSIGAGFSGDGTAISNVVSGIGQKENLLSNYVNNIWLDVNSLDEEGTVNVSIEFQIRNKKYIVKNDVKLRNKELVSSKEEAEKVLNKFNNVMRYATEVEYVKRLGMYTLHTKAKEYMAVKDVSGNLVRKDCDVHYIIIWDSANQKLYSTKRALDVGAAFSDGDINNIVQNTIDDKFLLTKQITGLQVNLDLLNNKAEVKVSYVKHEQSRTVILQKYNL